MPTDGNDVIVATVHAPMPMDAFVAVLTSLHSLLPDGVPERALLIENDPDGGFTLFTRGYPLSNLFRRGHYELTWVDRVLAPS